MEEMCACIACLWGQIGIAKFALEILWTIVVEHLKRGKVSDIAYRTCMEAPTPTPPTQMYRPNCSISAEVFKQHIPTAISAALACVLASFAAVSN